MGGQIHPAPYIRTPCEVADGALLCKRIARRHLLRRRGSLRRFADKRRIINCIIRSNIPGKD